MNIKAHRQQHNIVNKREINMNSTVYSIGGGEENFLSLLDSSALLSIICQYSARADFLKNITEMLLIESDRAGLTAFTIIAISCGCLVSLVATKKKTSRGWQLLLHNFARVLYSLPIRINFAFLLHYFSVIISTAFKVKKSLRLSFMMRYDAIYATLHNNFFLLAKKDG